MLTRHHNHNRHPFQCLQLERLHRRLAGRWPGRCGVGLHLHPDPALLQL